MKNGKIILAVCVIMMQILLGNALAQNLMPADEQYRPQIHFTPAAHWVNDPNGMVYYKGTYHLFFQYHPYSSVWGPMHWGHASSSDLVHWKRLPIAIYPDSLGTIFSGSAVVDKNNTSGFGKNGQPPLVAIFTQHNAVAEKAGRNDFQNQSIAYSLDEGKTWVKYAGNPVLKNPGIRDFRDPKVMWYAPAKKWVMTLATSDRVSFYSSPDLKNWRKESEFGAGSGAHGGGWECPDLFTLEDEGKQRWVLVANLNPGAPNGGSGTQYFIGDFDGTTFTSVQKETKWLDYGPDNYAGVTWSNTGKRKILIGWMTNWLYANQVPTEKWKNGMTIPRELRLKHVGNDIFLTSRPIAELASIQQQPISLKTSTKKIILPCRLDISFEKASSFSFEISNDAGEKLVIGYDKDLNQYFIDRSASGKVDFKDGFAAISTAPGLTKTAAMNMTVIADESSVELFADDGLTVMTTICFPLKPYSQFRILNNKPDSFELKYTGLKSIW